MMEIEGNIRKMETYPGLPVSYGLPLGEQSVDMNALLGKVFEMEFLGEINCIKCGAKTNRSFAQGYCYPCFSTAPETEECVLRPELCRAHEGVARDMGYARTHCLSEQVVYLALTSGLKVGVTRHSQVPTRWIDQGAVQAVELARTPNRYMAGLIEVALKKNLADKTNWRRMLTGSGPLEIDLLDSKREIAEMIPEEFRTFLSPDNKVHSFAYPVLQYPGKVSSMNFDRQPLIQGKLLGIKGQYLILDGNRVINMRKFGGYRIYLRV